MILTPCPYDHITGVARMALDCVAKNIEENPAFAVHVLPVCISYLHRERFRTSAGIRAMPAIVVDKSWLEGQ